MFRLLRPRHSEARVDLRQRRAWHADGQEPPAETPAPSGEIDLSKLDPAVKTFVEKLLEDKRAANAEAKKHREALRATEKSQEESARKTAEEQGEYKKLYERASQELAALQQQTKMLTLDAMRQRIGAEFGLPAALVTRLQGDSEDEMKADAAALKAALPATTPAAPGAQRNTSAVPGGRNDGLKSDAEIAAWLRGGNAMGNPSMRKDGDRLIFGG